MEVQACRQFLPIWTKRSAFVSRDKSNTRAQERMHGEVTEDATGLRYVITINDKDPVAIGMAAKIARRDVTGSSFWFEPVSDDDE